MVRKEIEDALDSLTENPLQGEHFECACCGKLVETVTDAKGVIRNPNEDNCKLNTAVQGRRAIVRTDFCSGECVRLWLTFDRLVVRQ